MPAGPKRWTETIIQRRLSEGRGQGEGDDFTPWVSVQEFSSKGVQTRIKPLEGGPMVHTFSYIERGLFLFIEFWYRPALYRAQFAMDRALTLGIAATLGIKHPRFPVTRAAVVMTLDAVVTSRDAEGRTKVTAYDCKPASELQKPRVMEKLSIHKAYCAVRGWSHHIFTNETLPRQVVRNLDWLRSGPRMVEEIETVQGMFDVLPDLMMRDLRRGDVPIRVCDFCKAFDREYDYPLGTGLRVFKTLVWQRRLTPNLSRQDLEMDLITLPGKQPKVIARRAK